MREASLEVCARMKKELASFRFLEGDEPQVLAPYFECRQIGEGEVLWREGDTCNFMAFIIEGRLDIKKDTDFKGKQIIVGVYGRGTVVGELCFMDGTPRAVTAVALEDSNLLILTPESFDRLLADHPHLGIKLLKGILLAVSVRLRKSFDRLAAIF